MGPIHAFGGAAPPRVQGLHRRASGRARSAAIIENCRGLTGERPWQGPCLYDRVGLLSAETKEVIMRRAFTLGIAALAAVAVTAAHAETVEEHHSSSYESKTVEQPPVVREHTTVETVPAPEVQKRTETVVKDGKDHDSDTKV